MKSGTDPIASLVGRAADTEDFVDKVRGHRLVVLTGDSGVGKTSLLNLGLAPSLKAHGFWPMICDEWGPGSGLEPTSDTEAFIASKVIPLLPRERSSKGKPVSLGERLDRALGDSAVLVLDQFEELIRYQPRLFHSVLDWIVETLRTRRTRIVISLRAEYDHRLRPLEKRVGPYLLTRLQLEPLRDPAHIRGILETGNRDGVDALTAEAAEAIENHWLAADGPSLWSDLGLLNIQATMYSLSVTANGDPISLDDVDSMIARSTSGVPKSRRLFEQGLSESLELKLKHCSDAAHASRLDPVLVEGTRAVVQRILGQLSSGGYKLVQERTHLGRRVLSREIDVLGLDDLAAETIDRVLARVEHSLADDDVITFPRDEVARSKSIARLPKSAHEFAVLGVDPAPWIADPNDVTSGPMLGLGPWDVLIEEIRRYLLAVEWLRVAALVRVTSAGRTQTMISLIHDGFAAVLDTKGDRDALGPREAVRLLTAARGLTLDWRSADSEDRFDTHQGHRLIANVRWRECAIRASFRRVVFANCDLRGSRFFGCRFEGVVFINCLLDGVAFDDCEITGDVDARPIGGRPKSIQRSTDEQFPSFVIPHAQSELALLGKYRGLTTKSTRLLSVTSGVAAVPWKGEYSGLVRWSPQAGGVAMYGGRLNSMMLHRCRFDPGSALALSHIAGSSLELAEQATGRVIINQAAIRGLSVTRAVGGRSSDSDDAIDIQVADSVVANVWFGEGLRGQVAFTNCQLWQLVNMSDSKSLRVRPMSCVFHGLVNVDPPEDSPPAQGFGLTDFPARTTLTGAVSTMDYRSRPALVELKARRKSTTR